MPEPRWRRMWARPPSFRLRLSSQEPEAAPAHRLAHSSLPTSFPHHPRLVEVREPPTQDQAARARASARISTLEPHLRLPRVAAAARTPESSSPPSQAQKSACPAAAQVRSPCLPQEATKPASAATAAALELA